MSNVARFIAGRLAALVVTMLLASVVVFGALYLAPGTPLGFLSGGRSLSRQATAALNHQYHLNQPIVERYFSWLGGILRGNFGESIIHQQSVMSLLGPRIANTALLIACATLLIVLFGVSSGLIAGVKAGRVDRTLTVGNSVALAVPPFIAAIILISLFSVSLGWFPVYGPGTSFVSRMWHLTLPAISLALTSMAFVARVTRAATCDALGSDHVDTALMRGLRQSGVIRRHVVRNALIPITTAVGLTSASLIAGSVVVDEAFALNGLGSTLVNAVSEHDYPVVQAITLILVLAFVAVNTVVDALYPLIDPRFRLRRAR